MAIPTKTEERSSQADRDLPQAKKTKSSPDLVVREILRGLFDGRFVPGQKLIEADLSRQLEVSRGSVREALNRLAAEGVITMSLHKGCYVRRLSRSEVLNVLRLMEVLVGLAARLAAEAIEAPGAKESVFKALERLRSSRKALDYFEFIRARNNFYRTLVNVGGNRDLERVLLSTNVHLVRTQLRANDAVEERARFREYGQIADAVIAGDPARAERMARKHIDGVVRSLDALPDGAFPDAV